MSKERGNARALGRPDGNAARHDPAVAGTHGNPPGSHAIAPVQQQLLDEFADAAANFVANRPHRLYAQAGGSSSFQSS